MHNLRIFTSRTKTGLFKRSGPVSLDSRSSTTSTHSVSELRALFRALSNPGTNSVNSSGLNSSTVNWLGYEQIIDSNGDTDGRGGNSGGGGSGGGTTGSATESSKLNPVAEEEDSQAEK